MSAFLLVPGCSFALTFPSPGSPLSPIPGADSPPPVSVYFQRSPSLLPHLPGEKAFLLILLHGKLPLGVSGGATEPAWTRTALLGSLMQGAGRRVRGQPKLGEVQ